MNDHPLTHFLHHTGMEGSVKNAHFRLKRDEDEDAVPNAVARWKWHIWIEPNGRSGALPEMDFQDNCEGKTHAVAKCISQAAWLNEQYCSLTPYDHAVLEHKAEVHATCVTDDERVVTHDG